MASEIGQSIQNHANAVSMTDGLVRLKATVIDSNEVDNKCTVMFFKDGNKQIDTEATVDLRNGQSWFPVKGEEVVYEIKKKYNTQGMVLFKYTENYAKDVSSKNAMSTNILPDGIQGEVQGEFI